MVLSVSNVTGERVDERLKIASIKSDQLTHSLIYSMLKRKEISRNQFARYLRFFLI